MLLFPQVREMLERFENIPDMLELDHLTVSGDVTFGKNVTLKVITGASECWNLEIFLKRQGRGCRYIELLLKISARVP